MDSNQSTGSPDSGHRNKRALTPPIVENSNTTTTLSDENSDKKQRLFSGNPETPVSDPSFRPTGNDNNRDSWFDDDEENFPPSDVILKLAEHVISEEGRNSNVVFSPLSINVVMALVAAGTNGGTLEELLSYFKADSLEALNSYFAQLISTVLFADGEGINSDTNGGPVILVSNSILLNKNFRLKNAFKEIVEADYRATLDLVDFQKSEEVAKKVNSWVTEHTRGLITEILPRNAIKPDIKVILINATYFKGEWEEKFDKSLTKDRDFHRLDGSIIQKPFMSSRRIKSYCLCVGDGMKVLGLPYKCGETNYSDTDEENGDFTMYFILPDSKTGLPDLVRTMGTEPGFFERHTRGTSGYKLGKVCIPKFKFSTEFEASNILENKLGLRKIFDTDGLIREMVEDDFPLYVSNVFHKACVEVNEDGVEAVAVTAARKMTGGGSSKPPKRVDFVADHPFMFVIREENTKAILFIGQVNNP